MPASPALPALPHTQYTHTQSHNRRHGSRLGAGRRGWDAAEQRSRGRLAAASEARLAGSGFDRVLAGPTDLAAAGSSSDARQVDRRAAVVMTSATTTAACTRARAARAHYTLQQGPRSTKRAPSTAIEFQRARLRVGKTAFTSTTMWRMFAARTGGPRALARSRRRARAACDLEGNRAGLGCLEHLRNALSFAVVTEWPVGVYPRRRRWSPPHACLVRAVGQSSPCECMSG